MPPKTELTSAATVAKFNSVLKTPVDTSLVDLTRASQWLANYLKNSCPSHEQLITSMVMSYMDAHRLPDPKVLQLSLTHMSLVPLDQVQRMMRRFWDMLLKEQAQELEGRISRAREHSPTKGSASETRSRQEAARGRTRASSPPPKRRSPRAEWDTEPKRARVDSHTSRPCEPPTHTEMHRSRRYSHMGAEEYAAYHQQYSDIMHHRPRAQHSGPTANYSRSYFV